MRWIKLHDSILDWPHFNNGNALKFWIYILLSANHDERKFGNRVIKAGQKLTSRRRLAEQLNMSVNTVQSILDELEQSGEIIVESDKSNGTLITVVNYAKYQSVSKIDTRTDTPIDTQTNTPIDTQTDTKQERNNNTIISKEEKNKRNIISVRTDVRPTIEELRKYISENRLMVDAVEFFAYYEANGWMCGRKPMAKWKAAVVSWDRKKRKQSAPQQPQISTNDYSMEEYKKRMAKFEPSPNSITYEQFLKSKAN